MFILAYIWMDLFIVAKGVLLLFLLMIVWDWVSLYRLRNQVDVERTVMERLSLSDAEEISYHLSNQSHHNLDLVLHDELPEQLQYRKAIAAEPLEKKGETEIQLMIRPVVRGEYAFGKLHLYFSKGPFRLTQRRVTIDQPQTVQVVPSVRQMLKYELQVFAKTAIQSGIRKVRQVGENDEFELIKPYTQGDNIRSINWKATSRTNDLMVNQYQNSRHQDVYCILDKGRSMKMPFDGMTLLDYSINSILTLSNIILKKYDYVGMISYSDTIDTIIKASGKKGQLERVMQALYREKTGFLESNYELLLTATRRIISRRSIWLFYTNFETRHDLDRHLPYLKLMCKRHLVVVIIFINTELEETASMTSTSKSDIYLKTFAQKTIVDKEYIKEQLIRNGIQTILTRPKDLSVNVINKYLEIKARRLR